MTSTLRIVPYVAPEPAALLGRTPALPDVEEEPSLTLCSTASFFRAAGPLGRAVGHAIERSSPFLSLIQVRASGWSIRWTSQLLWVDAGEVPAARHEWHIDRVGPGWNTPAGEVADFTDNAAASDDHVAFGAVSYFWPDDDGEGPVSLATEFLLEPLMVPVERLVDDPRTLGDAVSGCAGALQGSDRIATHGSDALVWFSARTLHRPPVADCSGWRFFLRVGLYREPYSRYADHRLCCHRLYDARAQQPLFRPVGTQKTRRTWSGPLSQPIRPCG
jgi:hypothetical protein